MSKMIHAQTLIQKFEAFAPRHLAFEGDRIGCQIGTLNKKVKKVMITLDVLENVVDEAIEKGVDLIISHHAVIYRPMKKMLSDEGQGKIISKCVKHDIAVYVAHTNFDIAKGGMSDLLSSTFGLESTDVLQITYREPLKKLAVYVPDSHAENVRNALSSAGAGAIGDYSSCSYSSTGEGVFRPGEGTAPFIGKENQLERVHETKIETIVPEQIINKVVNKMLKAHPYEEPAYDIYPIENSGSAYGIGRIGKLPAPLTLKTLAEKAKQLLNLDGVRVTGSLDKELKTAAISGGDGTSLVPFSKYKGADVLITGDIDYHTAHDALLHDLCLIDIGHHAEKIMMPAVHSMLEEYITAEGYHTEVIKAQVNTNPFKFM